MRVTYSLRVVFFLFYLKGLLSVSTSLSPMSEEKAATYKIIVEYIQESLNIAVNPCDDFYQYVCGRFNKNEALYKRYIDLQEFIQNPHVFSPSYKLTDAEQKMFNFLNSCKQRDDENVQNFVKHYNFSSSIGEWPVFNKNWSGDSFDLVSAIAELRNSGIEIGIDLIFRRKLDGNVIKIAPKMNMYRTRVQQIFHELELDNETKSELWDAFNEISTKFDDIFSSTAVNESFVTTFKKLSDHAPEIDWMKYMKIVTGRIVDKDFPIILERPQTLREVLNVLLTADKKIVANFFLSVVLQNIHLHLKHFSCYGGTFINFHTVTYRLIRERYFSEDDKKFFLDVIKSLLDDLHFHLNGFAEKNSDALLKQIEASFSNDFLPSLTEEHVNSVYNDVEINVDSYLENTFNLYRYKIRKFLKEFFDESNDKKFVDLIFSPEIFIQSFYNNFNKPSAMAFTLIGMPLVSDSVLYYRKSHPYSATTQECFKEQLNITKDLDIYDLHGIEGTEVYVRSYKTWSRRNEKLIQQENDIFDEFGFTAKKVFFTLTMQNACGFGEDEIPHKIILATLSNLKDFAEEYSCPKGSTMNPDTKCNYV